MKHMKLKNAFYLVLVVLLASCGSSRPAKGTVTLSYGDVSFEGGNGKNFKKAVVIEGAENTKEGVEAEMYYLSAHYGERGKDWIMLSKGQQEKDGKYYELIEIGLEGKEKSEIIYFDISSFYGKI